MCDSANIPCLAKIVMSKHADPEVMFQGVSGRLPSELTSSYTLAPILKSSYRQFFERVSSEDRTGLNWFRRRSLVKLPGLHKLYLPHLDLLFLLSQFAKLFHLQRRGSVVQ